MIYTYTLLGVYTSDIDVRSPLAIKYQRCPYTGSWQE